MADAGEPGVGRLVVLLGAFMVVGIPLVAYLWNGVNEVMAGDAGRVVVVVPLLAAFLLFLVVFGRRVRRLGPPAR